MRATQEEQLPHLTTEAANNDLLEIGLYLRSVSPRAAENFVRNVEKKLNNLVRFPQMGRLREEFAPNLRSFAIDRHVLFYQITPENRILVIRIVHGMRDISALFRSEEQDAD